MVDAIKRHTKGNLIMAKQAFKAPQAPSAPVETVEPVNPIVPSETVAPVAEAAKDETKVETISIQLPPGSRVRPQYIIAPPDAITAHKERWFKRSRLVSHSRDPETKLLTIVINKADLIYRNMVSDEE